MCYDLIYKKSQFMTVLSITVDNYLDLTGTTVILKCGDTTDRYTVKVETSDNMYIAKIYDADGKLVRTDTTRRTR